MTRFLKLGPNNRVIDVEERKAMQVISKEGLVLFEGDFTNRAACIDAYRTELGAEAIDYDGVDPYWADSLEIKILR